MIIIEIIASFVPLC